MRSPLDLSTPRSVGQIVSAALALYGRYPLLLLVLAGAVVAPYELIVLAATGYGPLRESNIPGSGSVLVFLASIALVNPFVSALHVHAVRQAGEGRHPTVRSVAPLGVAVLPVVAATSVMAFLGTALGFLALVVPGVILALRWAVAAQAAALENAGWQEALRSSGRLASGNYWHIFGLFIVTGLISIAIETAPAAVATGHAAGAGLVALGIAIRTLIQSFTALLFALLYFDLAARPTAPRREREYQRPHDLDP